jgi:hypothetical protein
MRAYVALPDHKNFDAIKEMIVSNSVDVKALVDLFDVSDKIRSYVKGDIEVSHGVVKYQGQPIHNYVTQKIIQFMNESLPVEPIVNFLSRLMKNPSWRAREELFSFLEHKNMPLTPEGKFRAYKGVLPNYNDKQTNTISNKVGSSPSMPRHLVCDDSNIACGSGLHAGSLSYARDWASDGHVMVVEICPSDVCSIPHDSQHQKLRCCKYDVVAELENVNVPLPDTMVADNNDDDDTDTYDDGYNDGVADAVKNVYRLFEPSRSPYETGYNDGVQDALDGYVD